MTLLKSRPAVALYGAIACLAFLLVLRTPLPAVGGGDLGGGERPARLVRPEPAAPTGGDRPDDLFGFDSFGGDPRLMATPTASPAPTLRPTGFYQAPAVRAAADRDGAAPSDDAAGGGDGEWQRDTPFGPFRLSMKDGRLRLTGEATIEADQDEPIQMAVDAEYAVLSDGTAVGVIQAAEGRMEGDEGDFDTRTELASLARRLTDQAFALRVYRRGGTLILKGVSLAVPAGRDAAGADDWVTFAELMLIGRWEPAGPAPASGVPTY